MRAHRHGEQRNVPRAPSQQVVVGDSASRRARDPPRPSLATPRTSRASPRCDANTTVASTSRDRRAVVAHDTRTRSSDTRAGSSRRSRAHASMRPCVPRSLRGSTPIGLSRVRNRKKFCPARRFFSVLAATSADTATNADAARDRRATRVVRRARACDETPMTPGVFVHRASSAYARCACATCAVRRRCAAREALRGHASRNASRKLRASSSVHLQRSPPINRTVTNDVCSS